MIGFYDLHISQQSDPLAMVQNYLNSGLVDIAEPNTYGEYIGDPNDPRFSDQWHHPEIKTPEAWDLETGDPSVIIGILDSGTDILHEDLEGNIWVNPGEDLDSDGVVWDSDDMNGIDDDGNGWIDDLVGWDFGNNNNNVVGPYYHGTHVAGIAGAVTNNNTGVASVAGGWYSTAGSKMLICGVGDYGPNGSILDDAILYAAAEGVTVITMSLTVGSSSAINAAIETAHNTYGCFIDCATGNANSSVAYPARAKYVFGVGASNKNHQRASFSNYGDSLDVVAPGVDIWSTQKNNTYGTGDGTSFAAPQIAGIAALLKSNNSSYTNLDIEKIIARSAEKVGGYSYDQNRKYGYWNNQMGYGRVNAFYAVSPPAAPQNLQQVATYGQSARLTWNANSESDLRRYRVYRKADMYPTWELRDYATGTTWTDPEVIIGPPMTTWYWKIQAEDWSGKKSGFSNEVSAIGLFKPVFQNPDAENGIPENFKLAQNFPNPFNPETKISFDLPEDNFVNLVVYNIQGEKVATLVNEQLTAGIYTAKFDGAMLPSGVYIYKIKAGAFSEIKSMVLVK